MDHSDTQSQVHTGSDKQVLLSRVAEYEANAGDWQGGSLASHFSQLIHALLGVGVIQLHTSHAPVHQRTCHRRSRDR